LIQKHTKNKEVEENEKCDKKIENKRRKQGAKERENMAAHFEGSVCGDFGEMLKIKDMRVILCV
jgi:hypothetical protein